METQCSFKPGFEHYSQTKLYVKYGNLVTILNWKKDNIKQMVTRAWHMLPDCDVKYGKDGKYNVMLLKNQLCLKLTNPRR